MLNSTCFKYQTRAHFVGSPACIFFTLLLLAGCSDSKEHHGGPALASQIPLINSTLVMQEPVAANTREATDEVKQVFEIFRKAGGDAAKNAVTSLGTKPYSFGTRLISDGHHDLALEWFIGMIEASHGKEKGTYYYGKAFTHFRKGEYEQAMADAKLILEAGSTDIIRARTYYLLGLLHSNREDYEKAMHSYTLARNLYEELGKYGGVYLSFAGMARIAIYQRDYSSGEQLIKRADDARLLSSKTIGAGRLEELKADICFMRADYAGFVEHCRVALKAYQVEKRSELVLWVNVRIGLGKALLGEFSDAYDLAVANDQTIHITNNIAAFHHNNLTRILYRRCSGIDYAELKEPYLAWAKTEKLESKLLELLALVESIKCPD
ncbi:MAG: tetratricopeptide repeat protein [Acidobacteriota bacterium]|nr:tetratricopeptide repeat protein [Acidobacteriota bacterium]